MLEGSPMRLAIYRWLENNAGDDAVYAGLRKAFPPDVEWVEVHLWEKVDKALAVVNACDGLIIGGGTIVGNLPTWILKEPFLSGVEVPVGILGTGIRDEGLDTIRSDRAPLLHRLLQKADPIALRGPLSKLFLEQSGFGMYPLVVVGDPALLLSGHKTDDTGTAINVRSCRGGQERRTAKMLITFINAQDTRLPQPISFFSCHDRWDLKPCVPVADHIDAGKRQAGFPPAPPRCRDEVYSSYLPA